MSRKIEAKSTFISLIMRSIWSYTTLIFKIGLNMIGSLLSDDKNEQKYFDKKIDKNLKEKKLIPVGLTDLIRPWRILVDTENRIIEVSKRNWFLIGMNTQTYQFKSVRNIFIDNHLFGADIYIQVYAGKATALSISKQKAKEIKEHLLSQEWTKPGGIDVAIDTEDIILD